MEIDRNWKDWVYSAAALIIAALVSSPFN